jgi:hypothetical protein
MEIQNQREEQLEELRTRREAFIQVYILSKFKSIYINSVEKR